MPLPAQAIVANVIMNTFAEVQDVIAEKKSIKQLKREIDEQKEVIDRRLEELRSVIASLITLDEFGLLLRNDLTVFR